MSYFQVAMDDRWRARVEKVEAFEDLTAPRLQHLQIDLLESPQVPAITRHTQKIKSNQIKHYQDISQAGSGRIGQDRRDSWPEIVQAKQRSSAASCYRSFVVSNWAFAALGNGILQGSFVTGHFRGLIGTVPPWHEGFF